MGFSINCAVGGLLKIHTEIKVAQKLVRVNTKKISQPKSRKKGTRDNKKLMDINKKKRKGKSFGIQAGLLKYLYFFLSNTTNDIFK